MTLYLVIRNPDDTIHYDEYDSFVCFAESEQDARRMHPRGSDGYYILGDDGLWHFRYENGEVDTEPTLDCHGWTSDLDSLVVRCLGGDFEKIDEPRVILASFNAG